ncbi:MAG: TlpA family protein disulfide reductase [Candidatus Saganbacteria bacterium]|nr:TlpA family protein disulfide reductase [Candidatus Saganbacteria bacterium]
MKNKYILVAVVLLIALGMAAYTMGTKSGQGGKINMIEESKQAPEFTLTDLEGNSVALSSFKGKVVFLNFWATWCPPCRAEMPSMQKLNDLMKEKDFVILAVDVGERKAGVSSFVLKNKYTFKVLLDSDHEVSTDYKVAGIPTTLILNKEGKIVLREVGSRNWATADIIAKIEELLK